MRPLTRYMAEVWGPVEVQAAPSTNGSGPARGVLTASYVWRLLSRRLTDAFLSLVVQFWPL